MTLNNETGEITGFAMESGWFDLDILVSDNRTPPRYAYKTFSLQTSKPYLETQIETDREQYFASDLMTVTVDLQNPQTVPMSAIYYVILDVMGNYYFVDFQTGELPELTPDPASLPLTLPPELNWTGTLFQIPLPDPLPSLNGTWYAALLSPTSNLPLGPIAISSFAFLDGSE